MSWSRSSRSALVAVFAAIAVPAPAAAEEDGPAVAALRAMSDWLAAQSTLEVAFDSAIEVITPELEKLQFASSGEALLARPDRLRARRESGHAAVEMVFDGTVLSIRDLREGGFATLEAPGSVDDLLELLHEGHGVAMPGAELFLSDPFAALVDGVEEAKHLGVSVIGGRVCEHLAFREAEVDWQLWIEAGDRPAPCRLIITTKTMAAAPAYALTITGLRTEVEIAADAFAFAPDANAARLDPNDLLHLDELPAPAE